MSFIWGDKPRTIIDPTRIDEAIAQAIEAHNEDPEAHSAEGQSLETHRESEIIDHRAESIVNDKLNPLARTHTALVGTGLASDFDTIQGAIEYVQSVGGGTILVYPGEYYLSGAIELPKSVNIEGVDRDHCIIQTNHANGDYFKLIDLDQSNTIKNSITNLTLISNNSYIFNASASGAHYTGPTIISNCVFKGNGPYLRVNFGRFEFYNCFFNLNIAGILEYSGHLKISNCELKQNITQPTVSILRDLTPYGSDIFLTLENSIIEGFYSTNLLFDENIHAEEWRIVNNLFKNFKDITKIPSWCDFRDNEIHLSYNGCVKFNTEFAGQLFFFKNSIFHGVSPNLQVLGDDNVICNNILRGNPSASGLNNSILNNAILP